MYPLLTLINEIYVKTFWIVDFCTHTCALLSLGFFFSVCRVILIIPGRCSSNAESSHQSLESTQMPKNEFLATAAYRPNQNSSLQLRLWAGSHLVPVHIHLSDPSELQRMVLHHKWCRYKYCPHFFVQGSTDPGGLKTRTNAGMATFHPRVPQTATAL